MLKGRKIVLGVCGSIAAYKAAYLVRLLIKAGAEVKVIMTQASKDFIAPLTFSTLSKHEVLSAFTNHEDGLWNSHVELGLWADALLIAPASANTIAKMAQGICDNLLTATYLSARCSVMVAPAMDLDMWKHPATQKNIQLLQSYGNTIIPVEHGELASGLTGEGRMAEPKQILDFLKKKFRGTQDLNGKKVLISAGPTREAIDPVRFISNHSSGKMGIALAEEARARGAEVTLILGPTNLKSNTGIKEIAVESAQEMYDAVHQHFADADWTIMAAAVSDYTPTTKSSQKIKKTDDDLAIPLSRTKDILKSLGGIKAKHQLLVGFALETNNEQSNAAEKLKRKQLDFIVLNSLRDQGAGFKTDTNKITILDKYNNVQDFELKSKRAVAGDIMDYALTLEKKHQ